MERLDHESHARLRRESMTPCTFSGRPRRDRSSGTLALVMLAVSSLMLFDSPAGAAARSCRAQCRDECGSECGSPEVECGPCVADQSDLRSGCRDTVKNDGFRNCIDKRCSPGVPGRCTVTRECVENCRADRQNRLARCDGRFRAGVRACEGGPSCLAAERTTRRGCVKQCRRDCIATCRATGAATSVDTEPLVAGCNCQGACVNAIVSSCYASCVDRCEGDTDALGVCKAACRDLQCDRLMKACTDDGSGTSSYALCCAQCDNCNTDLDDRFACVQIVTTTTTSSSSTTTASTTTSTTTTTF